MGVSHVGGTEVMDSIIDISFIHACLLHNNVTVHVRFASFICVWVGVITNLNLPLIAVSVQL